MADAEAVLVDAEVVGTRVVDTSSPPSLAVAIAVPETDDTSIVATSSAVTSIVATSSPPSALASAEELRKREAADAAVRGMC